MKLLKKFNDNWNWNLSQWAPFFARSESLVRRFTVKLPPCHASRYEIMKNKIAVKFCGEWFFFPDRPTTVSEMEAVALGSRFPHQIRVPTHLAMLGRARAMETRMGKIETMVLGRSSAIQLEMIFFPLPLLVFPPCFGWNKFPSILGRLEALFLLFFRLTGVGVWFSTIFLSFGSLKWKINILFSCAWRIFRCLLWRRPRVAGFVWMESERSMC